MFKHYLRGGSVKSLWQNGIVMPRFEPLNGDCKTDVLIIGGGIAGLLTAYFLHKRNIDYILVEKNTLCTGVSGNTTAKITFQHGLIYHKILKRNGIAAAKAHLDANCNALEKYRELCRDIDCDYQVKDNFVYSLNDSAKIEKELEALSKIGYDASFCRDLPLPFDTVGGVKFPSQAQFHPLKFLSHISQGLNIYENTFVKEMIGNTVVTDYGKIEAKNVVVATHFPFINKHGLYSLKLYQHRSYAIALENAPDVDGMYVDEGKKGMSFRNYEGLLIVGGGDHRTGKQGGNWHELRDFARVKYPNSREKFHWATQDCMSLDEMPYIGRYSKHTDRLFVASGFNKWGMTGAMAAAEIICDLIEEKNNEFASLFDPSRNMLTFQLAKNGFESVTNLLSFSTKRCPHLGCALKWNEAEHSWDCPCHGTRIDEQGRILDNPANGQ